MTEITSLTSVAADASTRGWARRLGRLWWRHQGLKFVGLCLFMWVFFLAYFHLLRFPAHTPTVMPLTPLDRWIGFQPLALWPYVSLWLYVGIAPCLLPTLRALLVYGVWAGALCLSGLLCFYLWPTAVPLPALDPEAARYPGFTLLRGVDAAGNACPSMHVAGAIFSACWTHRLLAAERTPVWTRMLNAGWFALIAWSTVAIGQHVVLDVLAGALLGLLFVWPSTRFGPVPGSAPDGSRYH